MTMQLREGDHLFENGVPEAGWLVTSAMPIDGCIRLFDRVQHKEEYVVLETVYERLQKGSWRHKRPGESHLSPVDQTDPNYPLMLQWAMSCLKEVKRTQTKLACSFGKAYRLVKAEYQLAPQGGPSFKPFPSQATLYRYRHADFVGQALLAGNKNKGRRGPRYPKAVDEVIYDNAKANYLRPDSRWTMGHLVSHINDELVKQGLLKQGQEVSSRYVRKIIHRLLCIDPDASRMDPKKVAGARSVGSQRIRVSMPFERVEQDALHLPFVVKTDHGVTSNVWLIHSIECTTSMPAGWEIVIGSPTEAHGIHCVYKTLNSKRAIQDSLGLRYDFDVFGRPAELVFDNGPEAKGERMQALTKLGIDVTHCKSNHPHQKPFIERLNRSLKTALETLPGCTRKNGKDGERDPVAMGDELMTLKELETWIVRWYFEDWANHTLERFVRMDLLEDVSLGHTPRERWDGIVHKQGCVMPLPVSDDEWRKCQYLRRACKLSRKSGVSYEGLHYKGRNLKTLIRRFGEARVTVLVDPQDYRCVYVEVGPDESLVPLVEEDVNEYSPAYSVDEYKRLLANAKAGATEHPAKAQFRNELHQRSAMPAPAKKSTTRNRVTNQKSRQAQAVQRAIEKPLPADVVSSLDSVSQSADSWVLEDLESLKVFDRRDGSERT